MSIPSAARQHGFTLIETIVVMMITAILAGIMVLFIRRPVQNYVDNAARADMADVAEIALRRMTRELRGALPNSVRWAVVGNTSYIEFIPTKSGARYLASDDGADPALYHALDFSAATARTNFDVVGPMPASPYAIAAGDQIVIYNLGSGFAGADAYAGGNRVALTAVNGKTLTMAGNPYATAGTPNSSPGKRFAVVGTPVTFACTNDTATGKGTLLRYWGYGWNAAQIAPAGGSNALMADNVYACLFSVTAVANQQTALIGLSIALARYNADMGAPETVTLTHQIHVSNIP